MRKSVTRRGLAGYVAVFGLVTCVAVQAQTAPRPGARLAFPVEGEVSALVIFVQHADEPDGAGSFGDDPDTEWPVRRSLGPDRRVPAWAEGGHLLAPPGTAPEAFEDGSLSAFYHLVSKGRFRLTGTVYPRVYVPDHPVEWYHENRGAFPTGAAKRSHEILTAAELRTFVADHPEVMSRMDVYQNGTGSYGADGWLDLVILVDRAVALPRLRRDRDGRPLGGSSITSLGADTELRPSHLVDYRDPSTDAFASDPARLGGLRVVDNLTSGSGLLVHALTRKQAVRGIAHEIGHRQFGFYHTCQNPLSPDADCLGIMGGANLTMSAGDRIKLGWAEVVPVDVPALGRMTLTVPDALRSGRVFRLRSGGTDQCGDVIVEARFWSNFWDSPPNPDRPNAPFYGNDDGDANDLFLPQEGLYLYKAPEPGNPRCGGNRDVVYDQQRFSSLENSGLHVRLTPFKEGLSNALNAFRPGGTYRIAYTPGDAYAPFSHPRFFYHEHPALDAKLTLTTIVRHDGAFTVEVWTDYLIAQPEAASSSLAAYPNPTAGHTTVRYEVPEQGWVRLAVYDVLGRRVVMLAEGLHQAGVHEIPLDATRLPAAPYLIRMQRDGRTRSVPLRVIR